MFAFADLLFNFLMRVYLLIFNAIYFMLVGLSDVKNIQYILNLLLLAKVITNNIVYFDMT
jgi:hypothetical protein